MKTITTEQTKEMLIQVADAIIAAEPYLTQVDTIIGDGDHGTGMKRGFTALRELLLHTEYTDLRELLRQSGIELVKTMGGASGVLFGTLFLSGAEALAGVREMDLPLFSQYFSQGVQGVMKRGRARAGQKTMLDALLPTAKALEDSAQAGQQLDAGLESASTAAQNGVEATKHMVSGVGRSKNFREHTLDHPDPGAISVSVILKAMSDYVSQPTV